MNRSPCYELTGWPAAIAGLFTYAAQTVPRAKYDTYDEWVRAVGQFFVKLATIRPVGGLL